MSFEATVIVRTRNEEGWIRRCLQGIMAQQYVSFEVIIVDNCSNDKTVRIVSDFDVSSLVEISSYSPGRALNAGAQLASGEFLVFISGHCVPASPYWLRSLIAGYSAADDVVAVYGRQEPLPFTHPIDRNDLLTLFGQESRIQTKDYFFHNANSSIRRSIWESLPFNEDLQTLEDREWAKRAVSPNSKVVYWPEASVFHHNGLHRTSNPIRALQHVRVLEELESTPAAGGKHGLETPAEVVALLPTLRWPVNRSKFAKRLNALVKTLRWSIPLSAIVTLSVPDDLSEQGLHVIDPGEIEASGEDSVDELLTKMAAKFEDGAAPPDYFLYVNWEYLARPKDFFTTLMEHARNNNFDTVFAGVKDFSHLWVLNDNLDYSPLDRQLVSREKRNPNYKAVYGLGTLIRSSVLRRGTMFGERVAVVDVLSEYDSRDERAF